VTVGTNYTGYDPTRPNVFVPAADQLSTDEVQVGVPVYDSINNIAYANNQICCMPNNLSDGVYTQGTGIFLQMMAMLNICNTSNDNVVDPATIMQYNLVPGDNSGKDQAIFNAIVQISTIGPSIDRWYGGNQIYKLGVFSFGYPVMFGDMHHINAQGQQWVLPGRQTAGGWFVNLQPGCYGTIFVAKRLVPPAVQVVFNGTPFSYPQLPI